MASVTIGRLSKTCSRIIRDWPSTAGYHQPLPVAQGEREGRRRRKRRRKKRRRRKKKNIDRDKDNKERKKKDASRVEEGIKKRETETWGQKKVRGHTETDTEKWRQRGKREEGD